ncbi:MAG: gamma carbonic anhydrase family protein [Deltaproteobacteria bacterium]|nr:gamma carbonic anhydrase family protein [Deltaproteobacteria bacterium]
MIKSFKGNTPRIAESAFVSEAAYVVGDVEIGENSSVWPGAVVRGDFGRITIGYNTAIEDNCVLHSGSPTTPPILDLSIGDNVVIGHGAVVNCKSIGSNVLIGINATLLHNAEIGDYCIIGAACLITHEMKVPDNSFVVGIPAKIKGKITPQQLYWVEQSPKIYVDLLREYKQEGL